MRIKTTVVATVSASGRDSTIAHRRSQTHPVRAFQRMTGAMQARVTAGAGRAGARVYCLERECWLLSSRRRAAHSSAAWPLCRAPAPHGNILTGSQVDYAAQT